MPGPRWILHADMDAFYASIEQRDHPELRGKPVIVGAAAARGVVAAASYEARAFGVRSAMPGFRAKELCPDGVFLPSNIAHYAAVSAQVHEVFATFTPLIEPLSLDEAFLDVSGSVGLFGGPLELGRLLKKRVRERTELSVSVAVAPNKLVAKIACTLAKPDGLSLVTPNEVRGLIDPLPVRRLWGVGAVMGRKLEALGITTFAELATFDASELARELGSRAAELQLFAQGIDERPVEADREPRSYGEENTFAVDVGDCERVSAALTAHAEAVARRVRRDGFRARTITLKAKLARARGRRDTRDAESEPHYPLVTRSKTLETPTDDGALIREVALSLWDHSGILEPVRLLGVSLSNLVRREAEQLELFLPRKAQRNRAALGPTLDAITERFGTNAISRAVDTPEKITFSRHKKRGEP